MFLSFPFKEAKDWNGHSAIIFKSVCLEINFLATMFGCFGSLLGCLLFERLAEDGGKDLHLHSLDCHQRVPQVRSAQRFREKSTPFKRISWLCPRGQH